MSNPQAPFRISHVSRASQPDQAVKRSSRSGNFVTLFRYTSRAFVLESIAFYQRYLSPHKGYHCAHRRRHGGLSCSEYVKQTIATVGLRRSLPLVGQRFQACRAAHKDLPGDLLVSRSSRSRLRSLNSVSTFTQRVLSTMEPDLEEEAEEAEDDRPAERVTAGEYYAPPNPDPLPPTEQRWTSCCVCGAVSGCCGAPGIAGGCGDPLEGCSVCWDGCDLGACSCCF